MRKTLQRLSLVPSAFVATFALTACDLAPRNSHIEWVARDAWDSQCAEKAMVETMEIGQRDWAVKGQVYAVDVKAKFRLTDDCQSGLPLIGKSYKSLQVVEFEKKGLELSSCVKNGDRGWSLRGQESRRCWTSPTLLPADKK